MGVRFGVKTFARCCAMSLSLIRLVDEVRPQVVVEIRNGDTLVQCDSCKRILFFEEEPA